MRKLASQGTIRYWALLISVLLHAAALAVITGVRLSERSPEATSRQPTVSMHMIQTVLEQRPAPIVKPKVEPVAEIISEPELQPEHKPTPKPLVIEEKSPILQQPKPVMIESPATAPVSVQAMDEVEFFGQKSIARRICYVVDCSGSMYGYMYRVKDKLKTSIMDLRPQQSFCVIFFMDGRQILMSGSGRLEAATASAKSQAYGLIDKIKPQGSTDAAHALECAMRLRDADKRSPDVIYFLTDGFDLDDSGTRLFIDKIADLRNSLAPMAVLHTIGFWPQQHDRQMLKMLAQISGGDYVEGTKISKE